VENDNLAYLKENETQTKVVQNIMNLKMNPRFSRPPDKRDEDEDGGFGGGLGSFNRAVF
jgi:hypothetical protein